MQCTQRLVTSLLFAGVVLVSGPLALAQTEAQGTVVQDTFLRAAVPDTIYGFQATFLSGNEVDAEGWRTDGLVQFDLPEIPEGQQVQDASLQLYMPQLEWANRGDASFGVKAVLFEWLEDEDTWSTLLEDDPNSGYGDTVYDLVFFEGADPPGDEREDLFPEEWVSWEVTDLVQAWYDGSIENNGFAILGEGVLEGTAAGGVLFPQFYSKDYLDDEDLHPALSITFGSTSLPGDFNKDGLLDTLDIDDLTGQSAGGTNPADYDLNADTLVDSDDIQVWIKDLFGSWVGDADLDGEFNTSDLVSVLASGTYEVDVDSVWSTGDFNGDGRTNTGDLVVSLADGGYEAGPRAAVAAVPEPSTLVLVMIGALLWLGVVVPKGHSKIAP